MSTDILFIGFGVFVAEVKSKYQCRLIPWTSGAAPAYTDANQFAYDTRDRLQYRLFEDPERGTLDQALARVRADELSNTPHEQRTIGYEFPLGFHDGTVYFRRDEVKPDSVLGKAPRVGHEYQYHLVTHVDDNGSVRRYHGFHAARVGDDDELFVINDEMVRLDLNDKTIMYTGPLAEKLLSGDAGLREGAVYIEVSAASTLGAVVPKLPPGAGQ